MHGARSARHSYMATMMYACPTHAPPPVRDGWAMFATKALVANIAVTSPSGMGAGVPPHGVHRPTPGTDWGVAEVKSPRLRYNASPFRSGKYAAPHKAYYIRSGLLRLPARGGRFGERSQARHSCFILVILSHTSRCFCYPGLFTSHWNTP